MDRIRARFNRHTSRLDNMRTLSFGQRTEGGRRVRLVQEEEGKEYHKEHKEGEEGGADILGLGIGTLPLQPGLCKGKPFSPRRDFSGSSPFKRKREPQESPEKRRASAPSLRQAVFPQAPILGRAATDGFNRLMMQGPRGPQPQEGLGLSGRREPSNQRLRLGSQNQGLGFGGFEQSFDHPRRHDNSRQQPRSQDWAQELGFGGFGESISQPRHQPRSGQQPQSLNQGPSFVWEPGAARHGSLLGFPPVSHIENRRSRIGQLREGRTLPFEGGDAGFLPSSFHPRHGRPANQARPARHGPPFIGAPDLRSFEEADDNYDDEDEGEWSSPDTARPPPGRLPPFTRPPIPNDASGVTSSNSHTRLLPQPQNNPWQYLPGFGDEEEEDKAITPNERRRRVLGQQPFMPSFHQQIYSQEGRRGDSAATFLPAYGDNPMANDGMSRGRAAVEDAQGRKARERRESEQRLRHSRLRQTRFGDGDGEDYDGEGSSRVRDQTFRVRQPGMGERGSRFEARPAVRSTPLPINFDDDEDEDDEEGARLTRILASSARHREEQSSSAHPFGRPAQQPPPNTAASRPRRSSSLSVHTSDLPWHETIGPLQQTRQRVQRQPNFMQHTQASRRRVSSGSSAGSNVSTPSPRRSFIQRASRAVLRGGALSHQGGRDGIPPAQMGRGHGAPFPTGRQSPAPNNANWSGPPQRPQRSNAMNPFAGRGMDGESSADEAPAPPRAPDASMHGRGRGGYGVRGGRGRGGALNPGSNARQPPAINHNHAAPNPQVGGRPRDTSASTAMAGLGLGTLIGNEAPHNTAPHRYAPPGVQPTVSLDGRAVYPTTNGGMMLMLNETISEPPKQRYCLRSNI